MWNMIQSEKRSLIRILKFNNCCISYYNYKRVFLYSDLRQVSGFLWVLPVSSTNKTDCQDITEILLNVALSTIKQTNFIKFEIHSSIFCNLKYGVWLLYNATWAIFNLYHAEGENQIHFNKMMTISLY